MDDTTTAIKQAVNIVDLIGESVRLEPAGSKFRGLCPFHDDHKPSFMVDPEFQNYRCWACGAKGDIFSFLQESEKISFVEAKQRLADKAGITLHRQNAVRNDPKQSLYRVLSWAQQEFQNSLFDARTGQEARQYLHQRGLTPETVKEFALGAAPNQFEWLVRRAQHAGIDAKLLIQAGLAKMGDRSTPYDAFRGRLMFPIKDVRNRVVAFGGRILPAFESDKAPKYLNSPATDVYHKSDVLFGLEVAKAQLQKDKQATQRRVLVVMEGYMDCLMAYQHGLRNAVATCGTALTGSHVSKLRSHADSVVLMFDGDEAGQKAARESVNLFLTAELEVKVCLLPDNLDPCDMLVQHGGEALRRMLDQAPDALEFQIQQAMARHDVRTVEGQHAALEQVLTTLSAIPQLPRGPQAMKYQLAMSRLSTRFGVSEEVLRQRITELRQRNRGYTHTGQLVAAARPQPSRGERERRAIGLIVSRPSAAGEVQGLLSTENIQDPDLRNLLQACYALHKEFGDHASVDLLRERLEDIRLARLALELCDEAPTEQEWDQAFADLKERLQRWDRQRKMRLTTQSLSPQSSDDDHLEVLRQLKERYAH